jgi:hypothetical protein
MDLPLPVGPQRLMTTPRRPLNWYSGAENATPRAKPWTGRLPFWISDVNVVHFDRSPLTSNNLSPSLCDVEARLMFSTTAEPLSSRRIDRKSVV